MKEIYIITRSISGEFDEILGIFSSEELANIWINKHPNAKLYGFIDIEKHIVDSLSEPRSLYPI